MRQYRVTRVSDDKIFIFTIGDDETIGSKLGHLSNHEGDPLYIVEEVTCDGCIYDLPGQEAHMDPGGCLYREG